MSKTVLQKPLASRNAMQRCQIRTQGPAKTAGTAVAEIMVNKAILLIFFFIDFLLISFFVDYKFD